VEPRTQTGRHKARRRAFPAFLLLVGFLVPCSATYPSAMTEASVALRPVRVLVADGVESVVVRSSGLLSIRNTAGTSISVSATGPSLTFRSSPAGLLINEQLWPVTDVQVDSKDGQVVLVTRTDDDAVSEVTYAGSLRILADGLLQVINEVDLEDYVASVVASEIWPNFEIEAFRAQAIITRTYVLYHMLRRSGAPYDVAATQGSQVYRGIREDAVGKTAVQAARYTRGLACAWNEDGTDRLFCTYYSAACGGMSQSAAPLGAESDIPPLAGGVRCDYCKIAPGQTYRWGPTRISRRQAYLRLCERYPDWVSLEGIRSVEPSELTRFGRPLTWKVTGSTGVSRDILAERFRLAVGPNAIKSTDCNVRVEGGDLVFENGKGYGHGLGLCQWGMQGMAVEGRVAAEIIRYYFPGSRLIRVY